MSEDTLALLAEELALVLAPLEEALASPEATRDLVRSLGWDAASATAPANLSAAVADLVAAVADGLTAEDVPVIAQRLASLVTDLRSFAAPPVPDPAAFAAEFPEQLLQHLLAVHVAGQRPLLAGLLRVVSVLEEGRVAATGTRLAYDRRALRLDLLPEAIADPLPRLRARYAWGATDVEVLKLQEDLHALASALRLGTRLTTLDPPSAAALWGPVTAPDDRYRTVLRWFLLESRRGAGARANVGVGLAGMPPRSPSGKAGLAFLPFASAGFSGGVELSDDLDLTFEAQAALEGGIGVLLHPVDGVQVTSGILGGGPLAATAAVAAGLRFAAEGGEPTVLLGSRPGSRLEVAELGLLAGARAGSGGQTSAFVELRLRGAAAVIEPGADADAFLARLLPAGGFRLAADLDVRLDSRDGLTFGGGSGLQVQLPAHVDLGIAQLLGLSVALRPDPATRALPIEVGVDVRGVLGPLTALVEDVGLRAELAFAGAEQNLGFVDLELGFKPPRGVGLSLDAGVAKGGGYLFLDPDRGEYAGAVELRLAGLLSVAALGLVTTRLPDGTPGFSLLLLMGVQFEPGLQLGYGFTLLGVGGIVGLNRTMRLDALAEGLRTGAAESVLFPTDVVANAPRLLGDLRAFFPAQPDRFLVGPMAKLGWGTPTLVSVTLGVVVEIPGSIAILGLLEVALPTRQAALLLLKVSFLGAIEPDKQRLWFFATLAGSRLLFIPLDGDMGLVVQWGDRPDFVVTVGGFHPRFQPPPLPFPAPNRISVPVLNTPAARIIAQGYLAVTSNTAQFGARAELFFGLDEANVSGHIGFDALFTFSPFRFIIEAGASVSLKVFGIGLFSIHLDVTLEGPTPWRARGRGELDLWLVSVSADFDITWGDAQDTTLPPVAVLPLLEAEVSKRESWRAVLPAGAESRVRLRDPGGAATDLVVHPLGTLEVRQRALPLALRLDRVGAQRPADVRRVGIRPSSPGLTEGPAPTEPFAPAQFADLSDAEKLSRPAFEPMAAGVQLAADGAAMATPLAARRAVRYEQIVIDSFYQRFRRRLAPFPKLLFTHMLAGGAAALAPVSQASERARKPFADAVKVADEAFVVAGVDDNRATATFTSAALAHEHLRARVDAEPELAGALHVLPGWEAAG